MKTSLKRILSALLVVVLAAGIFVASPTDAEAASSLKYDKKVTVYLSKKSSGYGTGIININTSKKITNVKTSNKSVAGGLLVANSHIEFSCKKAGKATISFKVGGKTYKSKVTVKKYTNPIKTLKVTGVSSGKNIASKVKKNREANVSLKKTKKNAKLTIKTAKNWKITEISVYDSTSTKTKVDKTYKKGTSKKKTYKLKTLNKNHCYFISITLKNKKNGGVQYIYYNINNNYKYY